MILQSLHALYDRLKDDADYQIAPPGYSLQKISFKVVLKPDGALFNIEDVRRNEGVRQLPRLVQVPGDNKPSGQGFNPCFLWDNGGYMLGFKPVDKKQPEDKQAKQRERNLKSFLAFLEKHLAAEEEIDSPVYSAVCRFLKSWDPEQGKNYPALLDAGQGFGLFQILGQTQFVHEEASVKQWWDERQSEAHEEEFVGQCLLTGETAPIARLQLKIKGIGDKQAPIASFNEKAYESYGKEKAYNSPISEEAAFQYGTALNALTDGPMKLKHRFRLADTTVVFWTDRPSPAEDIFAQFITSGSELPDEEEAQDEGLRQKLQYFFEALKKGREEYSDIDDDPDQTRFYILGLAPNAARISVRFFYQSTLSQLLDNLRKHYADMRVIKQFGEDSKRPDPEFPPLWMLLSQTARESKEIPPVLSGPLLRAVLTGAQYPQGLYAAVLRRIRADRNINYIRASIIKGCLKRNLKMEVNMALDLNRTDPGYRAGRLFAALEKTQKDALGDVGSSIRDRYYSSASSTPQSVFPRLLRTYQHHLSKLNPGAKVNREKLVQTILDPIHEFPAHLNQAEQGLFALGYYHQTKSFYTKTNDGEAAI